MSMFEENETSKVCFAYVECNINVISSRGLYDDANGSDEGEEFLSEESLCGPRILRWYGRSNGFSVRKSNVVTNSKGGILQQTFVCFAQGHRKARRSTRSSKKRQLEPLMRQSGSYQNIGFLKKDIDNEIGRQRQQQASDASGALVYLRQLRLKDNLMFYKHISDEDGRLQHQFWCDEGSQMNYQVFGDVLAFDATYRKNKYMCPVVIFSAVNNHNQTIVFASAIVSDETEQTYVWLLEQLAQVMKGKESSSVIIDSDLAMRNAIRKVFPNAHHRLCAWNLLRNATSNVGIHDFMDYFKRCMLSDCDVAEFEQRWNNMLHVRTTSRCEALHCHLGKFIHSRINLTEFMEQFHRFLTYFHFREVEADFRSVHEPIQINCPCLRMESIGFPCEHIIVVLVYLDYCELPKCLMLDRWTKSAKASIRGTYIDGSCYWNSHLIARYATLLELCRELCELASHDEDDYNHIVELVTNELHKLRRKNIVANVIDNNASQNMHRNLRNPAPVKSKGCGPTTAATSTRCRRGRHCGICGASGHNRRSCPISRQNVEMTPSTTRHPFIGEDEGSFYHNNNLNSGLVSG
ncbi:Zinc finger, CCHC-type [Sesbania bispinosa]|nr:Zinc finger, CCHC-type [Sesbania bispinosa]